MQRIYSNESTLTMTYSNLCLFLRHLGRPDLTEEEVNDFIELEIEARLDRAWALLNQADLPQDGYYAFVCEKCAAGFGYYGRFLDEQTLKQRAEELYAGA